MKNYRNVWKCLKINKTNNYSPDNTNHSLLIFKKSLSLSFILLLFALRILAVTNTWTGAHTEYWHDADSWSLGHVPLGTEDVVITPDGESTYNNTKLLQERKLILKYKFTNTVNTFTYHCTDTLTFRNRIRDGVNEWQDENPSHYSK